MKSPKLALSVLILLSTLAMSELTVAIRFLSSSSAFCLAELFFPLLAFLTTQAPLASAAPNVCGLLAFAMIKVAVTFAAYFFDEVKTTDSNKQRFFSDL
jgi:hypothetical protein